ncbi:MAG: hypothetical protein NUV81_03390 [bacterium]|nr:hypothetical protein [bacterium]
MDQSEKMNRMKAGLLVLLLVVFGVILSLTVRVKNMREIREVQTSYDR